MNPNATSHLPTRSHEAERRQAERRGSGQVAVPHAPLVELRQLKNYTVADGDPDIRGWQVKTATSLGDRAVGSVEDLLVDVDTLKVRYLLVCLDKDVVATTRDRRILVPIGAGRLDQEENEVRLHGITAAELVAIPEFRPGRLTRQYETTLRRWFASPVHGSGSWESDAGNFYEHVQFDDRYFWGARRRGREDATYLTRHD